MPHSLTLILACIIYWQAREISRIAAAPDFPFDPDLDPAKLKMREPSRVFQHESGRYPYFWEPDRTHVGEHASLLIAPRLRPLLFALFIVLHNYPSKPMVKRYDTVFDSLAESFQKDQESLAAETPSKPRTAALDDT